MVNSTDPYRMFWNQAYEEENREFDWIFLESYGAAFFFSSIKSFPHQTRVCSPTFFTPLLWNTTLLVDRIHGPF